ncbi:hypothetical protein [Wenling thamnaconus septentrionalis filovirus]|uniref:Uncharacterized protein n=1 Tax=Wenling thamnaconus septentrionalis filovirus TaxID=2116488 RepID=A0A2P1GMN2_9MONO|nr:hypothetical protein KM520_gp1 [Wenling thamnaconus septentrionalis filovirus]AVM87242.1 hypothetical protein [Wenling thamnaconus septentrionalis filovirus]
MGLVLYMHYTAKDLLSDHRLAGDELITIFTKPEGAVTKVVDVHCAKRTITQLRDPFTGLSDETGVWMFTDEGSRLLVHRFAALLKRGPLLGRILTEITVSGATLFLVLPEDETSILTAFLCILRILHLPEMNGFLRDMFHVLWFDGDREENSVILDRFCVTLVMMTSRIFTPTRVVRPLACPPVYHHLENIIIGRLKFTHMEMVNIRSFHGGNLQFLDLEH